VILWALVYCSGA